MNFPPPLSPKGHIMTRCGTLGDSMQLDWKDGPLILWNRLDIPPTSAINADPAGAGQVESRSSVVCKCICLVQGEINSHAGRHDQKEVEHHMMRFYLSEGELMGFHLNKSLRSSTGSQEQLSSGFRVSVPISPSCKPQGFILELWTQADRPFTFTAVEVTRTT